MIPADLLSALRDADPELWEDIYAAGFNHCQWPDYLIQGKLQEAIRARVGWGYQITAFGLPIIACVYNRRDYITARGESEAEALGWAYLAVIEGTCQSAAGLAG